MPAKRKGSKTSRTAEVYVHPPPPPPPPPQPEEIEDAPVETPSPQDDAPKKTKFPRTTATYTDQQKEEILDFLKANPSIYEKRRADYKNMQLKESLWQQQADKMGTSVLELKTWYNSQTTNLGR
ncbi:hypothetical protein DPMN_128540 [Dreissena polymorpha]|uniref:MADF domain-containing protein n=1 Tax=Dreissena polymorpha TaxID=45954 RepID=A0A9D4H444_DREPO|nr:hypothetical protein DPMN_128540 [Dreissena polymorpha]